MKIHEEQEVIKTGQDLEDADKAVIMIHGRGATAHSMVGLIDKLPDAAYIIPQAANRTWYPRSFLASRAENQPHLDSALNQIGNLVERASEEVGMENVYMLGFSQGACLASEYAAQNPRRYGGLILFSGGLIGDELPEYKGSLEGTPVYIGCSENDPHIPKSRVEQTRDVLEQLEADVEAQLFPGSDHTINGEELKKANQILGE